ncbi:hypothetical protein RJX39_00420 [Buchnera aphidicola (Taiwanaphis decaspermi)]|uniref:hypothetical protein n=1 Tax=Buchnera aphidicola TaxID=9 RepID=UPI0031B83F7A
MQIILVVPNVYVINYLFFKLYKKIQISIDIYHNKLTAKEKLLVWNRTRYGNNQIVIGTYQILFLSFFKLGMIILDDEHHLFYKTKNFNLLQCRDVAIIRSWKENIPIILLSQTPSIETIKNIINNKYKKIKIIKKKKYTNRKINKHYFFLKNRHIYGCFLIKLLKKINYFLLKNKKIIIIIDNNTYYCNVLKCSFCNFVMHCKICNHVYILYNNNMICYNCNKYIPTPVTCINCKSISLLPCSFGKYYIKTFLLILFPKYKISVLNKFDKKKFCFFKKHIFNIKKDIFILHEHYVTYAKGIKASLILFLSLNDLFFKKDFRTTYNLSILYFNIINTFCDFKQTFIIQTLNDQFNFIKKIFNSQSYICFLKKILKKRFLLKLPPYVNEVIIRVKYTKQEHEYYFINMLKNEIIKKINKKKYNVFIMGPYISFIDYKNCNFINLLIHSKYYLLLNRLLKNILLKFFNKSISKKNIWFIDVNPISI